LVSNQPNVSYICTRYYRAPELLFESTSYTTAVDLWSVGCVLGELLKGSPLFTADSSLEQIVEIIRVLGVPSKAAVLEMNPEHAGLNFPEVIPISLRSMASGGTVLGSTDWREMGMTSGKLSPACSGFISSTAALEGTPNTRIISTICSKLESAVNNGLPFNNSPSTQPTDHRSTAVVYEVLSNRSSGAR